MPPNGTGIDSPCVSVAPDPPPNPCRENRGRHGVRPIAAHRGGRKTAPSRLQESRFPSHSDRKTASACDVRLGSEAENTAQFGAGPAPRRAREILFPSLRTEGCLATLMSALDPNRDETGTPGVDSARSSARSGRADLAGREVARRLSARGLRADLAQRRRSGCQSRPGSGAHLGPGPWGQFRGARFTLANRLHNRSAAPFLVINQQPNPIARRPIGRPVYRIRDT